MPSHLTSSWNYAVSYLDMLYRDQKLGSGSGLFWKLDDRTFLISNWHNGNRGPCEQEPPRCSMRVTVPPPASPTPSMRPSFSEIAPWLPLTSPRDPSVSSDR